MIHSTISVQFGQFMNGDYLQIKKAFAQTDWIWKDTTPASAASLNDTDILEDLEEEEDNGHGS